MAYDLKEPLFISFHEHDPSQGGRARARGGGLWELRRPSVENNIVSQAHTASHRTHERNETISRLDSPPNLRSRSRSNLGSMLLVARPRRPKGVLAGPGTPRDPKSHLFVAKWVAVAPFGTSKPGSGSEFRPGSRRGGPGAQIPTFFSPILDPKMPQTGGGRGQSHYKFTCLAQDSPFQ